MFSPTVVISPMDVCEKAFTRGRMLIVRGWARRERVIVNVDNVDVVVVVVAVGEGTHSDAIKVNTFWIVCWFNADETA